MLCNTYRGQLEWHDCVFGAVANLVQMKTENEVTSIFQVVSQNDNGKTNSSHQKKRGDGWTRINGNTELIYCFHTMVCIVL